MHLMKGLAHSRHSINISSISLHGNLDFILFNVAVPNLQYRVSTLWQQRQNLGTEVTWQAIIFLSAPSRILQSYVIQVPRISNNDLELDYHGRFSFSSPLLFLSSHLFFHLFFPFSLLLSPVSLFLASSSYFFFSFFYFLLPPFLLFLPFPPSSAAAMRTAVHTYVQNHNLIIHWSLVSFVNAVFFPPKFQTISVLMYLRTQVYHFPKISLLHRNQVV